MKIFKINQTRSSGTELSAHAGLPRGIKKSRAGASGTELSARSGLPRGIKKWGCAALCAVLVLGMTACANTESSSTAPSRVSSAVSSRAPVSSAPVSSAPRSSAPASSAPESSKPTPTEDPVSSEEPSSDAGDFEAAFSQNPIDKQYDDDSSAASSFSMMRRACDTAAKSWKNMIDTAYRAALENVSDDERTRLQEEQDRWAGELDGKIEQLRADAGDTDEGVLDSSQQIVQLYRERAMALCKVVYDSTGELPAFETAPEDNGTPQG